MEGRPGVEAELRAVAEAAGKRTIIAECPSGFV